MSNVSKSHNKVYDYPFTFKNLFYSFWPGDGCLRVINKKKFINTVRQLI